MLTEQLSEAADDDSETSLTSLRVFPPRLIFFPRLRLKIVTVIFKFEFHIQILFKLIQGNQLAWLPNFLSKLGRLNCWLVPTYYACRLENLCEIKPKQFMLILNE